jgi:hypothetical protein
MNRIISGIFAAALLSVSSGAVMAQGMSTQAQANSATVFRVGHSPDQVKARSGADLEAGMAAASETSAKAGVSTQNYGSVISAIETGGAADLSAIDSRSSIDIVLLSSLEGEGAKNAQALDTALSRNADAIDDLHTSIKDNATLTAKLDADGYNADDVVAVSTGGEGSVFVYVDDRG